MQSIQLNNSDKETLQERFSLSCECPICCQHIVQAVTTPCGHSFCRPCLVRSLDHNRLCPCCREPLESCPPITQILVSVITLLYPDEQIDSVLMDNNQNNDMNQDRVPLLIGNLAFPHVNCAIHIFEPRYRLMLRRIMSSPRRRFAMCLNRRTGTGPYPFHEFGTILELTHVQTLSDGRSIVEAVGSHRFKVCQVELVDGYHMAQIERVDDVEREQEILLEQQQILEASAARARNQQSKPVSSVASSMSSMSLSSPQVARPASMMRPQSGGMVRPQSGGMMRPQAASMMRPQAASMMRPQAAGMIRPSGSSAPGSSLMQQNTVGQRQSWAQQAHPQTQSAISKAPWLQMHVRGLSAASSKPKATLPQQRPQLVQQRPVQQRPVQQRPVQQRPVQQHPAQVPMVIPEKVVKHRQEQSTEDLLNELIQFIEKLMQHKEANPNESMSTWLNALGPTPILRGPQRDRVVLTWWLVNMMPLAETEKYTVLPMRTLRERVLVIITWVDRFEDQWALFLKNPNATTSSNSSCCIS